MRTSTEMLTVLNYREKKWTKLTTKIALKMMSLSNIHLDTGWILGKAPEAYYGIPSKSLTPPQRGWKCYKGKRPAPTITYHKEKKDKQGKTGSEKNSSEKTKTEKTKTDKAGGKNQCNHRTKIYEEIIGTEEQYEKKLKTLIEVFLEPLLDEAYLPEELQTMLRLSRAIQAVAHDLLGYIQTRIRQRPSLVVSSAFIKYAPQFTCYTPYCVRFMSANNKLLDLMRDDEKFRKRVYEISIANDNERLDSLLIRPVQRITKYHLFFRDLLASLDSSHPHREALQTALATVKGIAEEVNKNVYSAEKSSGKLLEIYQLLNGSCEDLVKPGRIFQMELEVKFKHKHSSDEMKQVFMYVFSDLIVLAKSAPTLRNKQQQKMVLCFYHRNLTLENVSEDTWEFYLKNITNIKDNTCVDRYILRCSAQGEFDALQKLMEHLKNKQRQRTYMSLKRHRGTSRANASMKRGASLEALANKYRRNESADANSGSASSLSPALSKPRAWARRSMGGNERLSLLESRRTANSNITAASESPTAKSTSPKSKTPTRRKWASLRRGELRSRKAKFTGTLDPQALKDLKAMSLREEESLRKEALKEDAAASKAPAARQYTEAELAKMARHRKGIYKEIRQTEQEYMQALKMMLNTYKKPLLQKKIITDEESRIIFSNVEGLLSTSELLMQLLTGMDKEGVAMSKVLVDAFKMIIPTFKGYSVYCKDYQVANEMLNDKMKNVSVFRKHVHSEQQKTKKGGQLVLLQDLIIKPVQRICKYPLFFKAILDKTEDSHLMKKEFQALLMQVQQIANLVDARVKEYRERSKVVSVFNSVEGAKDDLLASNRRFLEELPIEFGPLSGSSVKYFKSKLFVFTDRLMVAKIASKKLFSKTMSLKYKHHFDMVDIKLSNSRGKPLELDITSVKTEGTVTVTKFRCRFGSVADKDRIKALIDAQRAEAFAASDDLQERRSKAIKTRTWQLKKRVTNSRERLAGMRERYQNHSRRGTL